MPSRLLSCGSIRQHEKFLSSLQDKPTQTQSYKLQFRQLDIADVFILF